MKKVLTIFACAALLTACAGGAKKAETAAEGEIQYNKVVKGDLEYTVVEAPQVDLADFPQDANGAYILFDGTSLKGWRGYGKDRMPSKWCIKDGCLTFNGTGGGEAQEGDGGDIIFAHKFKNFTLEFDWKVEKRSNSGVFYLAQEVTTEKDGETRYEPIYISSPEYQILDNENHPDSFLGVDGNRKSSSLYDMIPAKPQNAKPYGEWNTGKILVFQGTVVHFQNDEKVLEYHLWTPQWKDLLQASKFSEEAWPIAYDLLLNCGGENHEGYIGFQDHGDVVWYRNIRVTVMD